MKNLTPLALVALLLGVAGCTTHILFVESAHLGIKAAFEPNNPTPAELDIGWRRSVAAVVPKQSAVKADGKARTPSPAECPKLQVTKDSRGNVAAKMESDPDELMSLYTAYEANVGFGDPITVKHFLATGLAATSLMASEESLRQLHSKLDADIKAKEVAAATGEKQ